MSKKFLYLFKEGHDAFGGDQTAMKNTLGGKGAGLAEMTNAGMPVPQGFTITTEACTQYYADGREINEEIRDKELRVIDVDGAQLGILSAKEALEIAFKKDLDLVKIAPQAAPPVCRIMDYGKFCFEQSKREKEAKKNQKIIDVKEVRMSSTIDTHDFNTKVNQAIKFLSGGDKLKVSVRFRKRTVAHPQFGQDLLDKFKEAIAEAGVVDKPSKMEGRSLVMFVSPKVNK